MINILFYCREIQDGGIEKMMLEWITNLQGENAHFDILTERIVSVKMKNEYLSLGSKIYEIPYSHFKILEKKKQICNIIRKNHYDIIHVHMVISYEVSKLIIAKLAGIKVRIAHSHSAFRGPIGWKVRFLHKFFRPFLRLFATDFFACGTEAGLYMFGNKIKVQKNLVVAKNGINLSKFKFDEKVREEERRRLGISENEIIIGNVGRLDMQKNHDFLLDVFSYICKISENAKLLIIGNGELEEKLKQKALNLGILEKVIFYGLAQNVSELMCAMDIFVLTSFFEGLCVVLVEAQANGLPCIASDSISHEVNITDTVEFFSLNLDKELWADEILEKAKDKYRIDNITKLKNEGYDINDSSHELFVYYKKRLDRIRKSKRLSKNGEI